MPIFCAEYKEDDTVRTLEKVIQQSSDYHVFNLYHLMITFHGDQRRILRAIMDAVKSSGPVTIILQRPGSWLGGSGAIRKDAITGKQSDSDDSEDDLPGGSSSTTGAPKSGDLLYAILSWFRVYGRGTEHRVYVLFESKVPRRIRSLGVTIRDDFLNEGTTPTTASSDIILIGTHSVSLSSRCVCIQGPSGSGKSSLLASLATNMVNKVVWLYTHEVVNCELGESSRIVRAAFDKASTFRPSIVLMDDADMTLNSSGKIVKELVEEIGNSISEMMGVCFVFATTDPVPDFIASKVDRYIHL